jgi:hypothetical protein
VLTLQKFSFSIALVQQLSPFLAFFLSFLLLATIETADLGFMRTKQEGASKNSR